MSSQINDQNKLIRGAEGQIFHEKSAVELRGFIPCRIPGPDQSRLHDIKSKDVKIKIKSARNKHKC